MSKALQQQVDKLFEATKDLQSFEAIKPHCEAFNEWINTNTSYSIASLGTVLSRAGFYRKFKSLPLEAGKNADLVPKHDGEGNVVAHELKHYVLLLCGLDREQWDERNRTTRVSDRLNNGQEINPTEYLEVTAQLLDSDNIHEVTVGLIAATGRRPHEIIARANFKAIEGEAYQVMFTGQGKKRGQQPAFPIATLFAASYVIERLDWLRFQPSTKQLLAEVTKENPSDTAAQNRAIDSRRNGSLNRVVREYFGGKADITPILNFRHGEEQDNCKALRAAYLALATERDCKGATGSKLLYAARLAGHFVKENPDDRDLQHLVTTLGYADYYTTKPVPLPEIEQYKLVTIKAYASDLEKIQQLQKLWGFRSHQQVIRKVFTLHEEVTMQHQLQQAQNSLSNLEQGKEETKVMPQLQDEQVQSPQVEQLEVKEETDNLNARVERLENLVTTLLENLSNQSLAATPIAKPKSVQSKEQGRDWQSVPSHELRKMKVKAAVEEKLNRVFQAVANYNDNLATSNEQRWYIGNVTLRELSGANGQVVTDWINRHQILVDDHNNKYGLGQYHNKRHRGQSITDIVNW